VFEFLKEGKILNERGQEGRWSAENGRLIIRDDKGQEGLAYAYQISGSTLILTSDGQSVKLITQEAARKADPEKFERGAKEYERKAKEKANEKAKLKAAEEKFVAELIAAEKSAKAAGFIALAPGLMNWSDAKAYCASKGGRLPLIRRTDNNREIIDGIGSYLGPWPSALPKCDYIADYDVLFHFWSGTEADGYNEKMPDVLIFYERGDIQISDDRETGTNAVVCVP